MTTTSPLAIRRSARLPGLTVLVALTVLTTPALAATLIVAPDGSGDYATIQAALDAALDGDTIMLLNGTFSGPGNRDLVLQDRSLTILSKAGDPAMVTIACGGSPDQPHRFLAIIGYGNVEVAGITITGGHTGGRIPGGGGLLIANDSQAQIRRCVFVDNHTAMSWDNAGGAVYVDNDCDPTFTECEFRQNSGYFGGAVAVNHYSHATFDACLFADNVGGRGGAVWGNSTTKIACVLVGNTAQQGGAIWGNGYNDEVSIHCTYALNGSDTGTIHAQTGFGAPVVLQNTVIAYSSQGLAVHADTSVPLQIACTDIFGNMGGDWEGNLLSFLGLDGNFAADPCFCDLDAHELGVCGDSVCLPPYNPGGCQELIGALSAACPDCNCGGVIATEARSWSAVRGIFDR